MSKLSRAKYAPAKFKGLKPGSSLFSARVVNYDKEPKLVLNEYIVDACFWGGPGVFHSTNITAHTKLQPQPVAYYDLSIFHRTAALAIEAEYKRLEQGIADAQKAVQHLNKNLEALQIQYVLWMVENVETS
jgi:hypothetical protein